MAKIVIPLFSTPPARYPIIPPEVSQPPFQGKVIQQIMENTRGETSKHQVTLTQVKNPSINNGSIQTSKPKPNPIYLVDFDYKSGKGGDRFIELPTVPRQLEYDPSPNWAVIASIGRNSPFFHYSGSEDTLTFTIDWYSKEDKREDVIYKCKWVEAKTKADGYIDSPHRILVKWGNENRLFDSVIWVVTKASYRLLNFVKNRSMLPQQAYQEISLKRVADFNLTMKEVYGPFYKNSVTSPNI